MMATIRARKPKAVWRMAVVVPMEGFEDEGCEVAVGQVVAVA